MAFILPAWDGQKRVKYVGPDGATIPQEDRRWHWLQANLTQKLAQGNKGEEEETDEEPSEKPQTKQLTPREALERIYAAREEIDVILDLVSGIEDGQHLAVGMVTPSQKSLQAQNRERALTLAAKQTRLQGAAERLQRGAELLSQKLEQDDRYYSAAAQLQRHWKLKVDISLPFKVHGRREPPAEQLPLQRLPDGSVHIRHQRQRADAGVSSQHGLKGISQLLHKEQRGLVWASLKRAMEGEAAEMETADTTHVLVQVLLSSAASETAGTQDLAARLLDLYYKAVEAGSSRGRGRKSPILKPAMSWLQHSMLQQEVAAELKALASSTAALAFSWLPMPKQLTSVALLRLGGGPPFSLIIREGRLYLEGALSETTALAGANRQRSGYPGHKQLRKEQLKGLPLLMKAF